MPDETDIIISELTNAPQIDDSAVFPLTQDNGGSPATFKASMSEIAGKVAEGTTFVNLETTAKNLVGAINEAAQGGGGSADIISTASGTIATFNDGGDNIPVKSLVTDIVAVQAGTGTPSPSNPRSISGFSSVNITVSDGDSTTHTNTISLGQTVYGGSLECVSGSGQSDGVLIDLANYTGRVRAVGENENKYFRFEELSDSPDLTKRTLLLCDKFPLVEMSVNNTNIGVDIIEPSTLGYTVIAFRPPNVTSYTTQTVMNYISTTLNGLQVCYRKATPTPITTTPEQIPTLSGVNNIFSNTGDVEIEYFNNNADQTSELIDAKQEFANYSSEEKVVGKWLDGSTLYEKTLYFNNVKLDKSDSTSELVHGISDIGSVRFVSEVYFDFSGGVNGWSPANNGLWNNGVYNFYWVCGETSLYILSASGVYFDANSNRSYLAKIRYTKA